nr:T9SS type A sorting domain-containing protein [uncultured Acetobacteroides sp.]
MRRMMLYIILLVCSTIELKAQTVYLKEGFELGRKPDGWTEEAVVGSVPWRYRNGGYNPADPNLLKPAATYDMFRNPDKAKAGTYNAWYFTQGFGREQTRLITPPLNLKFAVLPTLKFWLTIYEWRVPTGVNNDILRIYYKVGFSGGWRLLQTYNFVQNEWRDFQLNLPSDALQKDVYLAFEGLSRWGMGICLDEVKLEETGSQAKSLVEATPEGVTTDIIPNGTTNNPILCSRLKVTGNTGDAILSSVKVNAIATKLTDITRVTLYATQDPEFNTSTPIASGTLSGSSAVLTASYSLPTGYTYLWATYDIASDAKSGNTVDAEIPASGITVNGTAFANATINSGGNRIIKQNLFFDDFETDKGWSLSNDFEIAAPMGKSGAYGNPDPENAVSGSKVLGNDLTKDGVYDANIPSSAPYTATSPSFDALFYKGLVLNFKRWLNVDMYDTVKIQASKDNGATWATLWKNTDYTLDDSWQSASVAFPAEFDRAHNIKLRYTLSYTNGDREFTGWNIDDVSVVGNFMEKDLAMVQVVSPTSTCGSDGTSQPITLKVRNAGSKEAVAPIPVKITINGGSTIDDNITQNIAPGAEATVTLSKTFPAGLYGDLKVLATTLLPGDEDNVNDTASVNVHISKTYKTPYTTSFDTPDDWTKTGYNWMHGVSTAPNISGDSQTDKMWITNLNGNYDNNAKAILTSPCFDIIGLEKPMLEIKANYITELNKDGVTLSYSTDNGATWQPVGKNGDLWDDFWGWKDQASIASSGKIGFTGNSNGWQTISHLLPAGLNGATGVKFRFEFTSDATNGFFSGFGLNGFAIKEAPDDFGISGIVKPVTLTGAEVCGGFTDKENITFKVKNCGIKTAKKGAPVKVSFKSEYSRTNGGTVSRTEEFEETYNLPNDLPVGSEVQLVTSKTIDMNRGGFYNITVTNIDNPEYFYKTDNDKKVQMVEVKKPTVDLGPTVILGLPTPSDPLNPNNHEFDITTDADGFGYTIKWEKKIGEGIWGELANNGYKQAITSAEFVSPNNKISFKVTLTDNTPAKCSVSSTADVYKLNPNVVAEAVVSPANKCSLDKAQAITVKVTNKGQAIDVIKAGTEVTLRLKYKGALQPVHKTTTVKDLAAGESFDYIFPETFDMSAKGTYPIEVSATIPYDINTADNLAATIESYGFPAFTLTPQTQTVNALEYTYDADPSLAYKSYEWYDKTTLKTNKVIFPGPADSKVWCTVTDEHGCSTKSEATITFAVKDVAVKSINNIQTACTHEPTMKPSLTIENRGNVTIPSGTAISFEVTKNGATSTDSYTLTAALAPGASADIILNNPIDISAKGAYTVAIVAKLAGDLVADNNAQTVAAETYGLPQSSLPPTITTKDVEVTLDAGAGFTDYKWSTSDITQTILVSKDGKYDVKITDANKCSSIFSTQVAFIKNDLSIDLTSTYGTSSTVCTGTTEYPVSVKITNVGNDTPKAGTTIPVTFKVGSVEVSEVITLANDLAPNASIEYTFAKKATFTTAQPTGVSAMITLDDLDLTNNFSKVISVTVNQTPTVSLGDDIASTESSYTIVPTVTPDLASNTYLWSTAATSKTLTVTNSGAYTLTATNQGCSTSDEVMVNFNRKDIAVAAIDSPKDFCAAPEGHVVAMSVKNSGMENIATGTKFTLSYTFNGNTVSEETTLAEPMAVGKTIAYTFTQKLPALAAGSYSISATATFADDGIAANNTLTGSFKVNPAPTFTLANPITSNEAQVAIAGPAGMTKYVWSTGAETQSITATQDGSYTLTVTDANGCSSAQTTQVLFTPDIELTSVVSTALCQGTAAEPLTLTVANKSGKTIAKNTPLKVSGTINGTSFSEETLLSADLAPQASTTVTLAATLPRATAGQYPVSVTIAALTGESNTANNKTDATVTVNPSPTFTLPADIVSSNAKETIDGPAGMASYAWTKDGVSVSQDRTITVTLSGTYTLKVTNDKGCSAEASIKVQFKGGDLVLQSIVNNEKMCQSGRPVPLSLVIGNDGDTPIAKGETITVSVKANGTVKTESYVLAEDLLPKSTTTITLTTATGIPAATAGATVTAEVSVSYQYDVNPNNPAVSKTFKVVANPTFSIDTKTAADKSSATLSGSNTTLTYLWSNGAATKDITVYENSLYKVTGTNADGCILIKEIAIDYLTPKATNFITLYPAVSQTKCYDGKKAAFEVKLVNESQNITVPTGTDVKVSCSYQIAKADGKTVEYSFSGTVKLSADLKPTQSIAYSFDNMLAQGKQAPNMVEGIAGKHTITGSTEVGGIKSPVKTSQFEIYPAPTVSLGSDVLYRPLPTALTVNLSSEYAYLWSTGEKTNSIIVNAEGKYWVSVTSKNQCSASDTVEVKRGAEALTLQLSIYPNPASTQVSIVAAINTDSEITVDIYSAHGMLLESMPLTPENITKLSSYDVSHLESGSYPVVARTKDKKVAKLLIIAR